MIRSQWVVLLILFASLTQAMAMAQEEASSLESDTEVRSGNRVSEMDLGGQHPSVGIHFSEHPNCTFEQPGLFGGLLKGMLRRLKF